jgi:hypothetical protein
LKVSFHLLSIHHAVRLFLTYLVDSIN